MALVDEHRDELGVNVCLELFSVPRSSYYTREADEPGAVARRDDLVYAALQQVVAAHPAYGWRRLQVELFEGHGIWVNHKRLKRILSDRSLALQRNIAERGRPDPAGLLGLYEGSADLVRGRSFDPLQAFSTDFTEIVYGGGKKAWLMVFVDIDSKLTAGPSVASSRNRELALRSLSGLVKQLQALGLATYNRVVHHDKDGVYTSYAWLSALLLEHGMMVSFSENGARHNPWVESLWSRTKAECHSRFTEAQTLREVEAVARSYFNYHNHDRRHSALGNTTPMGVTDQHRTRRVTRTAQPSAAATARQAAKPDAPEPVQAHRRGTRRGSRRAAGTCGRWSAAP